MNSAEQAKQFKAVANWKHAIEWSGFWIQVKLEDEEGNFKPYQKNFSSKVAPYSKTDLSLFKKGVLVQFAYCLPTHTLIYLSSIHFLIEYHVFVVIRLGAMVKKSHRSQSLRRRRPERLKIVQSNHRIFSSLEYSRIVLKISATL